MSEIKFFPNTAGAHKYAQNSSRKHNDDRYIVSSLSGYYVQSNDNTVDDGEKIIAHYKNGVKIK